MRQKFDQEFSGWKNLFSQDAQFWETAHQTAGSGKKVLIATSMGGYLHGALVESMLSAALTLRGADVDILLCKGILNVCQITKCTENPVHIHEKKIMNVHCLSCGYAGLHRYDPLGLRIFWYDSLLTDELKRTAHRIADEVPVRDIGAYTLDGIAIGEHAMAGALRYYAVGNLVCEPDSEPVLRKYLEASLLTTFAMEKLVTQVPYDVACFNHGIYVPQGLIGEVCRKRGIRVVTWNPAYRKHCFIFSHGDSYHHTMISESSDQWEHLAWTSEIENKTMDYLKSRWQGTRDWIWFHDKPTEDLDQIKQETGLDFSKPVITLLTNVMWDAQLHYRSNAFSNMMEWILKTIAYFETRNDLQLVIRVHPAELRGLIPSRQLVVDEIKKIYPILPSNVAILPPENQVSTYRLAELSNAVIIYNTKTGIEISSMGIPVVVAGEAWIRNKGFSYDASNPVEYFNILNTLPLSGRLTREKTERAKKYAFHFFFRRMIPLLFIVPKEEKISDLGLNLTSLRDLCPGKYKGLDVICDGILEGKPFIYPAEEQLSKENCCATN